MGRAGTLIYNITRNFTCMGVNAAWMGSGCSSVGLFGYRTCLLQMYVHLLTFAWVNVALPQARAHFLHFFQIFVRFWKRNPRNTLHVMLFFVSTVTFTKPVTTMACSTAFLFGIVFFILYFVLHFDLCTTSVCPTRNAHAQSVFYL